VDTDFSIQIKRLRNARALRLRVLDDGRVTVTAPLRMSERVIQDFIHEHQSWIAEHRQTAELKQQALTKQRDALFFRGQELPFRLAISQTKKPGVELQNNQIIVTAKNEDHTQIRPILEKWYRQEAEKRFKARVPLLSDLVNKEVKNVTIRSQRTRWGSCSSRNTISLNWLLIMAPDRVSDYVIYHELAHLTHMNHSNRFWQLVEEYDPNYKQAEQWLTKHHQLLNF